MRNRFARTGNERRERNGELISVVEVRGFLKCPKSTEQPVRIALLDICFVGKSEVTDAPITVHVGMLPDSNAHVEVWPLPEY